jgi:hydroxymethylpyrimidine pyrophosphatase-like HAD family hydrolase
MPGRRRFSALATDYDGTLAEQGAVAPPTLAALRRFRDSGRKLILVTGRHMPDLWRVFPPARELFDAIVAENGGTLYLDGEETLLAPPPEPAVLAKLLQAGVMPLVPGRVVIATLRSEEPAVRAARVPLDLIFNSDSLMLLPPGIDKGTGLEAAGSRLALSLAEIVAVGDNENDQPMLEACGYAVAVANAVPRLKRHAALVTHNPAGAGIVELIERILEFELLTRVR